MRAYPTHAELHRHALALLGNIGKRHAVGTAAVEAVLATARTHHADAEVLQAVCVTLQLITQLASNAAVAVHAGAVAVLLVAMREHITDAAVQGNGCSALGNIMGDIVEDTAQCACGADAVAVVMAALRAHGANAAVLQTACRALGSMTEQQLANKKSAGALGAVELLLAVLRAPGTSSAALVNASLALGAVTADDEQLAAKAVRLGALETLVTLMRTLRGDLDRAGCCTIHSLSFIRTDHAARALRAGALGVVQTALHAQRAAGSALQECVALEAFLQKSVAAAAAAAEAAADELLADEEAEHADKAAPKRKSKKKSKAKGDGGAGEGAAAPDAAAAAPDADAADAAAAASDSELEQEAAALGRAQEPGSSAGAARRRRRAAAKAAQRAADAPAGGTAGGAGTAADDDAPTAQPAAAHDASGAGGGDGGAGAGGGAGYEDAPRASEAELEAIFPWMRLHAPPEAPAAPAATSAAQPLAAPAAAPVAQLLAVPALLLAAPPLPPAPPLKECCVCLEDVPELWLILRARTAACARPALPCSSAGPCRRASAPSAAGRWGARCASSRTERRAGSACRLLPCAMAA
jgi:hypothetical protein